MALPLVVAIVAIVAVVPYHASKSGADNAKHALLLEARFGPSDPCPNADPTGQNDSSLALTACLHTALLAPGFTTLDLLGE